MVLVLTQYHRFTAPVLKYGQSTRPSGLVCFFLFMRSYPYPTIIHLDSLVKGNCNSLVIWRIWYLLGKSYCIVYPKGIWSMQMHSWVTHYDFGAIEDACTGSRVCCSACGLYPAMWANIGLCKSKALLSHKSDPR